MWFREIPDSCRPGLINTLISPKWWWGGGHIQCCFLIWSEKLLLRPPADSPPSPKSRQKPRNVCRTMRQSAEKSCRTFLSVSLFCSPVFFVSLLVQTNTSCQVEMFPASNFLSPAPSGGSRWETMFLPHESAATWLNNNGQRSPPEQLAKLLPPKIWHTFNLRATWRGRGCQSVVLAGRRVLLGARPSQTCLTETKKKKKKNRHNGVEKRGNKELEAQCMSLFCSRSANAGSFFFFIYLIKSCMPQCLRFHRRRL